MVGRSLFSPTKATSRDQRDQNATAQPPPPYNEDTTPPDNVVAKTLTTTVTTTTQTTHTTTHFFSLPHWRRRPAPRTASSSGRPSTSHSAVNEDGTISRPLDLLVDKDLPATPTSEESAELTDERKAGWSDRTVDSSVNNSTPALGPSFSFPSVLSASNSSSSSNPPAIPLHSQPTRALAHAALGLGLPHVMPRASTSSLTTDATNSIPFISPVSPERRKASTDVRRAKSFSRTSSARASRELSTVDAEENRRTRGVSLVPTIPDNDRNAAKGKGKQVDRDNQDVSGSKPLVRRSSFWSRRRLQSTTEATPTSLMPDSLPVAPSLPSLQPISPLVFDKHLRPSPPPSPQPLTARSTGLHRRHSERSASYSSNSSPLDHSFLSSPPPPISESSPHRAVHKGRPATADSSSYGSDRPKSLFVNSFSSIASPPSPIMPPQSRHRHSQEGELGASYKPRPRSQTNPPRLLHRLSMGIFTSSPPPVLVSSPTTTTSALNNRVTSSPSQSGASSPIIPPAKIAEVPKPRTDDDESPELFLGRLEEAVSKAEIANVLASSDAFYARALQAYIDRFNFTDDPLDVALRKLLMDVGLPKETQQIDRVMEAFAARYSTCNPGLYVSDDHPYILAFSLIMLHTDAFNKSNKRKMTKPDYIKNTRLPGVPAEVLECFFDNIVFAPFIFIEDPLDVNGQRGLVQERSSSRGLTAASGALATDANGSGATILSKGSKVDPYYIIARNMLDLLRVDVESHIPLRNPYSYQGTAGSWDEELLHRSFAHPDVIEVGSTENRRLSSLPFFAMSVGGAPTPVISSFAGLPELIPDSDGGRGGEVATLKVTKVGLLNRKEDLTEGGKKATNRKWKEWSVILTGSQILFFRDPAWALGLIAQAESSGGQVLSPHVSLLKPDELLSVKDAIAVHDITYAKYDNTLRFVLPTGRQFLLQAEDEQERNEWIAHINYASAFKTAGIRMRAMTMSDKEVELTGMAAAVSHLQERRTTSPARTLVHSWATENSDTTTDDIAGTSASAPATPPFRRSRKTLNGAPDHMDLESFTSPRLEAYQLKATFDQVKADLAACRDSNEEPGRMSPEDRFRAKNWVSPVQRSSLAPDDFEAIDPHSRSQIIGSKFRDLESKISVAQAQLDADIRFVRNLAVLTPFQRSTRDRVQRTVISLSKRVMQVRLDIVKLVCHRNVLKADLAAEERDWQRSNRGAFRAATETLQKNQDKRIPRMTLSVHDEGSGLSSELSQPVPGSDGGDNQTRHHRPESSICESFHSALDFSPDWPGAHHHPPSSFSYPSHGDPDSPAMTPLTDTRTSSINSFPFSGDYRTGSPDIQGSSVSLRQNSMEDNRPSSSFTDEDVVHERFYTAAQDVADEQAEEWNKTRAAKRVSLVKLPSDLRVSGLFVRQSRNGEGRRPDLRVGTSSNNIDDGARTLVSEGHEDSSAASAGLNV